MSDTPPACRVDRLRLIRFRNYVDETVELGPGLNVLAGPNAQGKTNFVEAVATIALTRSPRSSSLAELIRWGDPAGRAEAAVRRPDGLRVIDLRIARTDGVERTTRTITVDGTPRSARAVLGLCPVVLFLPDDLALVKGGPESRRRLLDVVLSQVSPDVGVELVRYRRVLEQRNALLRQIRAGSTSAAPLGGFSRELVRAGGVIRAARSRLITALGPLAAAALGELTRGAEALDLDHLLEGGAPDTEDAGQASDHLARALGTRSGEEVARGVSVTGPHRDDLEIRLAGRPARSTASQGQQRSLVLALKLAEVRHLAAVAQATPVLLLDDVLSELDAGRRDRLLTGLGAGSSAQALLTTTDPEALAGADIAEVRYFAVEAGHLRPTAAPLP